ACASAVQPWAAEHGCAAGKRPRSLRTAPARLALRGPRATNGLLPERLRGREALVVSGLQVLDGTGAAEVEEIRARAAVSCSASLPLGNVCEAVLDDDALTQAPPTSRGCDPCEKAGSSAPS